MTEADRSQNLCGETIRQQMTARRGVKWRGLTKGQRGQAVGGHGELVEAVQLAELAREAAQVVAVGRQALQGQALVQPLRQRAQQVHRHVQGLQLTQLTNLCGGTRRQSSAVKNQDRTHTYKYKVKYTHSKHIHGHTYAHTYRWVGACITNYVHWYT